MNRVSPVILALKNISPLKSQLRGGFHRVRKFMLILQTSSELTPKFYSYTGAGLQGIPAAFPAIHTEGVHGGKTLLINIQAAGRKSHTELKTAVNLLIHA